MRPIIEMRNVHKWFGKVHAVQGVSLKIYPNEVVGLVGDNGAGKSTLIEMLSGVLAPTSGEIYVKGNKCLINSVDTARKLGIETVHQAQAVAEDRSVAQNIFLGRELCKCFGPIKVLDKNGMRNISTGLTRQLGLNIPSPDHEVRFCSGGERQGVAIARAMYFKARVVILDEPTTALSIKGRDKVLELVKRMKQEGISIIFITHNIHHVYPVADRFVVMFRGKIVKEVKKKDTTLDEIESLLARKEQLVT
ncbi:MAG: ATP-binding cassette domain-containing protein [Spirochaetota bacterium]